MTAARTQHHVQVNNASYLILGDRAEETGKSMTAALDAVLDNYRRELFYAEVAVAWQTMEEELMEERAAFAGAIGDGLEREEW
jgi:hypothetical protein